MTDIDHNNLIRLLCNKVLSTTFYTKEFSLYSELIKSYNYNLDLLGVESDKQRVNLVGILDNTIIFVVEFENHNVEKSFINLENYTNVPLRVLYVSARKYNKALALRDEFNPNSQVQIYKYYEGFERDFIKDIHRILYDYNSNTEFQKK